MVVKFKHGWLIASFAFFDSSATTRARSAFNCAAIRGARHKRHDVRCRIEGVRRSGEADQTEKGLTGALQGNIVYTCIYITEVCYETASIEMGEQFGREIAG